MAGGGHDLTPPVPGELGGAARRRSRRRTVAGGVAGTVLVLGLGSAAGLLPLQAMHVASGSMAPTLVDGDLVLVDRLSGTPERMDVVAAEDPPGEGLVVKRVVGLGGDTVALEDGVLVVNRRPVCESAVDLSRVDGVWFGPVTVPADSVFLLGDARDVSVDSRDFGPVAESSVVGLVTARLWPHPGGLPRETC